MNHVWKLNLKYLRTYLETLKTNFQGGGGVKRGGASGSGGGGAWKQKKLTKPDNIHENKNENEKWEYEKLQEN